MGAFVPKEAAAPHIAPDLAAWARLADGQCLPGQFPYTLRRWHEASGDAARLAFARLPPEYWRRLQRLEWLCSPADRALASGRRLTTEDVRWLTLAVTEARQLREEAQRMIAAQRRADELAPDVALRVARVFGDLETYTRFLFASAFPCSKATRAEKAAAKEAFEAAKEAAAPQRPWVAKKRSRPSALLETAAPPKLEPQRLHPWPPGSLTAFM
mmetsp:Transcript_98890/g.295323  ORF Transcript_98890/g.295323 Transcript_98890/m.295323 type:complete len:214 (-) Transcript_98890:154-795(-)